MDSQWSHNNCCVPGILSGIRNSSKHAKVAGASVQALHILKGAPLTNSNLETLFLA